MSFSGSALAGGESAAFSPPCPRMFLLILNPTRRHFEGADFLAKKMTSARPLQSWWIFFSFFTFLKHFSPSLPCQARGTAGASPLRPHHRRQAPTLPIFTPFNLQIPILTCKSQLFPLDRRTQGPNLPLNPTLQHPPAARQPLKLASAMNRGVKKAQKSPEKWQRHPQGVFAAASLTDSSGFLFFYKTWHISLSFARAKPSPELKIQSLQQRKDRRRC